jgi:hypothetical protein
MSDTTSAGMSRRKLLEAAGTTAAAVAAAGLAGPAAAATPKVIPFKATFTVSFQSLTIPLDFPIVAQLGTGAGQSDQLGKFTVAVYRSHQMGLNGEDLGGGANPGVFTADNGDALFWTTGYLFNGFLVTGGKGRFCGAAGNGTIIGTPNPATGDITFSWDGMIRVPNM